MGRADHSSRGVILSVVCLSVIVKPRYWGGPGPLRVVVPFKKYIFRQGLIITENGEQFFVGHDVYSCIRN
jgi:hypothetical protein